MLTFKRKKLILYSPVEGESLALDCVPDAVFASKMMGDGIAFSFPGDTVYAPCDAKVILIPKTKHAIGLQNGKLEVLIHIGLDTVNLKGEGFESLVKVGSFVKKGTPLLRINRQFMKEKNVDLISPMVITSRDISFTVNSPALVDLNSQVIQIE